MIVAKVLRNVMAANYAMLAITRADVDGIAHDTITALEFEDGMWSGDNDTQATLGIAAGVAAIIAGIATLPAGGGAVAVGGFTILSGAMTTLQSLEGSRADGRGLRLGADTIEDVLDNMATALNVVYGELDKGNQALAHNVMDRIESYMADNKNEFRAPRPTDLAEATPNTIIDLIEGP